MCTRLRKKLLVKYEVKWTMCWHQSKLEPRRCIDCNRKFSEKYRVYCGFATNCLARSLRSHHQPVSSKSDNIPARSFAALIHRLPSSQPLAYIIARLWLASLRSWKVVKVYNYIELEIKNEIKKFTQKITL